MWLMPLCWLAAWPGWTPVPCGVRSCEILSPFMKEWRELLIYMMLFVIWCSLTNNCTQVDSYRQLGDFWRYLRGTFSVWRYWSKQSPIETHVTLIRYSFVKQKKNKNQETISLPAQNYVVLCVCLLHKMFTQYLDVSCNKIIIWGTF